MQLNKKHESELAKIDSNINIDISNHPSGVYLLEISAKDCVCVQKIIIE